MANINVFIKLISGTQDLRLESNGQSGNAEDFVTEVDPGDWVFWKLSTDSGIDDITGIEAKGGSFSILFNGQAVQIEEGLWGGVVKNDASGEDSYNISFSVGQNVYTVDPKIQVKN